MVFTGRGGVLIEGNCDALGWCADKGGGARKYVRAYVAAALREHPRPGPPMQVDRKIRGNYKCRALRCAAGLLFQPARAGHRPREKGVT